MTMRMAAPALAALLLAVTFSGCIALGGETHTITVPPLRNGAVAQYEGYPGVSGPVEFRIHADHAPLIVDGSSHDCIRGTYTFTNGTTQMVCLSYDTYEPLVGSFEYPVDKPIRSPRDSVIHIFDTLGLFDKEALYLAFQATGRTWNEGDTMEASWFGVPLIFKSKQAGNNYIVIETSISFFEEGGRNQFGVGEWNTWVIRFALTNNHPFPIWFSKQLITEERTGRFYETAHLNWGVAGEGEPLDGPAFDWMAHRDRLVPYEQGWPPDGNRADCAGRIGPEWFVELALQHEPAIGRRLQEGTLVAYSASRPDERELEFKTVTESSGQWAFPDGTKQSYRIEIQESTIYGKEITIHENSNPPKKNKHFIERYPIHGLPYCEAIRVLDEMRPGRSLVQYGWPQVDGSPEGAWIYDLESRWGDSSGPFLSYAGGALGLEVALITLQTGFITDPPPPSQF